MGSLYRGFIISKTSNIKKRNCPSTTLQINWSKIQQFMPQSQFVIVMITSVNVLLIKIKLNPDIGAPKYVVFK